MRSPGAMYVHIGIYSVKTESRISLYIVYRDDTAMFACCYVLHVAMHAHGAVGTYRGLHTSCNARNGVDLMEEHARPCLPLTSDFAGKGAKGSFQSMLVICSGFGHHRANTLRHAGDLNPPGNFQLLAQVHRDYIDRQLG